MKISTYKYVNLPNVGLLIDLHIFFGFFATGPMEQLLVALKKIWQTAKIMMKMKKFKQAVEFLRSVNYAR